MSGCGRHEYTTGIIELINFYEPRRNLIRSNLLPHLASHRLPRSRVGVLSSVTGHASRRYGNGITR